MIKRSLILIFFLISFLCWSDTHNAASASYADVNAAVGDAITGDLVVVPAGSETWDTQLLITKGITLQGAGTGSTIITRGVASSLIRIELTEDVPVRVTGFYLDSNGTTYSNIYVRGTTNNSFCSSQVRVDHCYFEEGSHSLYIHGWVEGVADNNTFHNCSIAVMFYGDNDNVWGRYFTGGVTAAGTSNAFFVEDNEIILGNVDVAEAIYHQCGARSVIRHNIFDAEACTSYYAAWFDSHGNWPYYDPEGENIFRGQPLIEVYENIVKAYSAYRLYNIRGGSLLIYNNTMTTLSGGCPGVTLQDEESWQTAIFDPLRESWPAQDQIMNTFIWGNTANGVAIIDATIDERDAEFIQKDRDYFIHAPESTGGHESYTDRAGASDTEPTNEDGDGTMIFTAEGANAYYPYTPYTYPHPLRGYGGGEVDKMVMVLLSQIQIMPIFWALFSMWAYVVVRIVNKL